MSDRNYITVSELNFYLHNIIDAEELLHGMYLLGEISGVSITKGNLYCTIKDDGAQLPMCCFGVENTYIPENGERVLVFGSPDFYAKGGKLSYIARRIEPFGKGKLHIQLELLKKKLLEEGLFSDGHKTPAPRFPIDVVVVTSINGAVIRDIVTTIRKYNELINITIIDVAVQGKDAVKEIVAGLRLADKVKPDVVILARGGGSFEDLLPFNNEEVVRAIYNMDTYCISAVGHETDYTLADFVADDRALTPTAAAEMVAFDTKALKKDVISSIKVAGNRLSMRIDGEVNKVISKARNVQYVTDKKISEVEAGINARLAKLSALNPVTVLQKGYFRVTADNQNVARISELKTGDEFTLHGADGALTAMVKEIKA